MKAFTIIVPVFDETAALSFSKAYFASLGVRPLYVLNSEKSSRRAEVEAIVGQAVPLYENHGACLEDGYENLANVSPTDWILRVDCDEVPNQKLLDHAQRFVSNPTASYCAYDRDDLIWRGTKFERVKYSLFYFDSQFRLFNRNKVKFRKQIHTPGFYVPKWKPVVLPWWHGPLGARFYHLNREFTSPERWKEKFERYNSAGQDQKWTRWMMTAEAAVRWKSFDDESFTRYFAAWKTNLGKSESR